MEIRDILEKYRPAKREDLIRILQHIQESEGYLSEDAIVETGRYLGLSTTKIYGLATFYDEFRFLPAGKIHIRICNGTSCYLNGSAGLISKIRELTGIEPGQTTRDGLFSYELVSCMGGCTNGPVITVNGEYMTHIRPEQLPDILARIKYLTGGE